MYIHIERKNNLIYIKVQLKYINTTTEILCI